ncbi:Fic family protein [Candidatus Margulisiibacteriota bacterium]
MPRISRLEEKALSFWAKRIKDQQMVVASKEIPGEYFRKILVAKKLAFPLRKGLYLFKKPEQDSKEQLYLNYWAVVNKILAKYIRWSIRGKSALDLYLGVQRIPKRLLVRTNRKAKVKIILPFGLEILVVYDPNFNTNTVCLYSIMGQKINLDIAESLLFEYKKTDHDFTTFITTGTFDYRIMEVLYQEKAQPIVAKRLIQSFNKSKRFDLAKKLQSIIEEHTAYRVGTAKQQIPSMQPEPQRLKPWTSRLNSQIMQYEKIIEKRLQSSIKKIKRQPLKILLAAARNNKKYDIYHSTTIEGYHITPEEVSEVLFRYSKDKRLKDKQVQELRNKMAILGYSYAFDFILSKTNSDYRRPDLSENLIKDLYFQLFRPSADLKIIDRFSLTTYRSQQNYIRGSRHVPPAPGKVVALMEELEKSINLVSNPVIKAILVHSFFAYIHPYVDGNGRCSRLLMNYMLLTSGYHWITIRAENREKYFNALEESHLNQNIIPFASFILSLFEN